MRHGMKVPCHLMACAARCTLALRVLALSETSDEGESMSNQIGLSCVSYRGPRDVMSSYNFCCWM